MIWALTYHHQPCLYFSWWSVMGQTSNTSTFYSHHFQVIQVIQRSRVFLRHHQVPEITKMQNIEFRGWLRGKHNNSWVKILFCHVLTARPFSPSTPLSPCKNKTKPFINSHKRTTWTGSWCRKCDDTSHHSTYINAINSWDTCRSRRTRRSLTPLRKIFSNITLCVLLLMFSFLFYSQFYTDIIKKHKNRCAARI